MTYFHLLRLTGTALKTLVEVDVSSIDTTTKEKLQQIENRLIQQTHLSEPLLKMRQCRQKMVAN